MTSVSFPMTREIFEAERARAAAAGFPFAGDSGTDTVSDVTIRFQYDEVLAALVITVVSKPFWVPMSVVLNKLKEGLQLPS